MRNKLLNVCLAALLALVGTTASALDKVNGVYQIGTVEDLMAFAELVNGGDNYVSAVLTADINCGTNQFFIGDDETRYNGNFDGQGHKVTVNFFPEREGENLFRYVDIGGHISNLIVDGKITTDKKYAAAIAGWSAGVIQNCVSLITVYSSLADDCTHGGIVGVSNGGGIINCLSAYKVKNAEGETSLSENCGGIVGWLNTRTTIRNCLSIADIDLADAAGSACIARNGGSLANNCDVRGRYQQNFYLNKCGATDNGEQVTVEQLASGEVCYKLNVGVAAPQWTQKEGDAYPMPFPTYGKTVGASAVADCAGNFAEGTEVTYTFGGGQAAEGHQLVCGRCEKCGYFDFNVVPHGLDGYYQLTTADDCRWYSWRRYYGCDGVNARLMADIDVTSQKYFTQPDNWCAGDFDGAGHTLTIALSDEELDDYIDDDEYKELGLKFRVQPFKRGNLCLFHNLSGNGQVHDLIVKGTIKAEDKYASTITNHLRGSQGSLPRVYNVMSFVDIEATGDGDGTHAGIVGVAEDNCVIRDVAYAGKITTTRTNCGGLIGWSSGVVQLTNALMIGDMETAGGDESVVSRNGVNCQIKNVYYKPLATDLGASAPEAAIEIEDDELLTSGELAYKLNGDQSVVVWTQNLGEDAHPYPLAVRKQVYAVPSEGFLCDGTPLGETTYSNDASAGGNIPDHQFHDGFCDVCGSADLYFFTPNAEGKYEVANAKQLACISQIINRREDMLDAQIVLTGDADFETAEIAGVPMNQDGGKFGLITKGFEPIGPAEGKAFRGSFDGQFHTISNLHINKEGRGVGLFGVVAGKDGVPVRIENVVMDETCTIWGGAYVGLIGMSDGVGNYTSNKIIMNNVGIECDILADGANAGGIIGCCMSSAASFDITYCYTTGHIKGGKESSAMTGWFGAHAKCVSCWTISEVEGTDSDEKYFGRFDGAPELINCFSLYGTQSGVGHIEAEDVESGKLTWELNGKSFADPVWYQNLNEGDEHPSVLPSRGSVFVTDDYHSATDAQVADAANELKTYEQAKIEDVVAQLATIEYYTAQLEALEDCATMNELGAAYEALDKDSLQKSVKAYTAYVTRVNNVRAALAETYKALEGPQVELLKEYLDERNKVEPNGDWPNGSYAYVIEEALLDVPGINAEIARIDAWLDEAIRTCYGAGMEVTDLLANANFAKGFDGWTQDNLTGKTTYTNEDGVSTSVVECWAKEFDMQQTITGLKPGVYVFGLNGVFRPSDNIYSYNHTATIYANGIHNYIMTPAEDMVLADDAVNGVNCYFEAISGAPDANLDFPYFEDPRANVNGWPEDDYDLVGFTTRGQTGMAIATAAGRNQNYVLAIVGEDGTLTVGATNPGTKMGNDGTLMANATLHYFGTVAEAADGLDKVLESMKARANSEYNDYNMMISELNLVAKPGIPSYSAALRDELKAAADATAATAEEKVALIQKLSQLFLDIYECKQAYIQLYKQINLLTSVAVNFDSCPEDVDPMLSEEEVQALWDLINEANEAYSDADYDEFGTLTTAEVMAMIDRIKAFGLVPNVDENGVYEIATGKQLVWFSAAVNNVSTSLSAKLVADINVSGVNFEPIGNANARFAGTFDGQDHTISGLYANWPGVRGVGLIGHHANATVKNLIFDNTCYFKGDSHVGSAVGSSNLSGCTIVIDRVATWATVESDAENAAGIHGCSNASAPTVQISNCFVGGIINAGREGGAISGWMGTQSGSFVKNCLAVAEVYNSGSSEGFLRSGDGPSFSNNYVYIYEKEEIPEDRQDFYSYLSAGAKGATKVERDALEDGSLTYKLNGSQSDEPVWFQNLEVDKLPRIFGAEDIVYLVGGKYTNERPYMGLNPFAYDLGIASNANNATIGYGLNADAIEGEIIFKSGDAVVYTEPLKAEDLKAGRHDVVIDNSNLPAPGTKVSFEIKVKGQGVTEPYFVNSGMRLWKPNSIAVNNCTESIGFGNVYIAEAETPTYSSEADLYVSGPTQGNDLGIYTLTPNFVLLKAANGKYGYTGGLQFNCVMEGTEQTIAYEPKTVRVSKDGRVFVGRTNCTTNSSIYELNPANLDEDWTPIFVGGDVDETTGVTYVGDDMQHGMNVSFDVEGTGADLKLYVLDCDKTAYNYQKEGFWGSRYDLGTAKTWAGAPSAEIPALTHQWTAAPSEVTIISDQRGGLWYIQYRSTPSKEEPSLVHINANGVVDYENNSQAMKSGAITMSADGNYIAYSSNGSSQVTVATVKYEQNEVGKITISPRFSFEVKGANGVNALAFDYAGNLYIGSALAEKIIRYVLPSTTGNVYVTPAPSFESFAVGQDKASGIDGVNAGSQLNGEIYNLSGVRTNKAQKGINIINGQKVMVK